MYSQNTGEKAIRFRAANGDIELTCIVSDSQSQETFMESNWRCSGREVIMGETTSGSKMSSCNRNCSHGGHQSGRARSSPDQLPSFWDCFSQFCQQTILHGWHYLTEDDINSPPVTARRTPEETLRYTGFRQDSFSTPLHSSCHTGGAKANGQHRHSNDLPFHDGNNADVLSDMDQAKQNWAERLVGSHDSCDQRLVNSHDTCDRQHRQPRVFTNCDYTGVINNNNRNLPNNKYNITKLDSGVYRSVFWSIIVFASVVSGGFFLHDNTSEFLKSTVQTTLDSMVPLSQVLFPSVVVCNINQIRKSFFNELGFYENETLVRIMYEDFIKGTRDNGENSNYTGEGTDGDHLHDMKRKEFYEVLKNYLLVRNISINKSITWLSHQPCDDMFLYSKWNGSMSYDHGMNKRDFGTDYGICCWYTPQLNFSAIPSGPDTDWNYWFGTVKKGAKTGKDNGFSVLFDIESFDYGYYDEGSEGLKVAIVHHLDMPIMRQRAFHVSPGTENQIPITPTLYTANPQVLNRFTPKERDCYQEHEIDLMYLPKSHGYRYEMSNCLFEAAFEKILEDCKCAPGFHNEGGADAMQVYEICKGENLACSNEILNRMGQYNQVKDMVDNITKECLSNCEDQTNDLFVTTSLYPNKKTFKDREEFCILGKKLLLETCKSHKRLPLSADFPELCGALESLPDFLHQCRNNRWRRERVSNKKQATLIENQIYEYARSNLAIINIFIKEPYSKRFRKTEKMSRIAYIASSGGLLGLCMGFSFVSLAEILYHCFICVSLFLKRTSKSSNFYLEHPEDRDMFNGS